MISVFDGMASRDYTRIGDCVLTPESCRLHQVAAGAYDLTMVHTVDPGGKWRWLVEGNLIKAPVQWETMEMQRIILYTRLGVHIGMSHPNLIKLKIAPDTVWG